MSNFERQSFDNGGLGGSFTARELLIPTETTRITAEALVDDNHSPLAFENRQQNQEAFENGEIDLTFACSDARIIIPNLIESLLVGVISAGGNREGFRQLIDHQNIRAIFNLAHYGLAREQKMLQIQKLIECGGLQVKDLLERGLIDEIPNDSTIDYVNYDVDHSDPLVQTAIATARVAEMNTTKIPIVAAAENHRTGEIGILGVFLNWNGNVRSYFSPKLDTSLLQPKNYDPHRIYENGIPFLNIEEDLPKEFESVYNYVKNQNGKMERMGKWYPNLGKTQAVQNRVKAVLWTSSPRPAHLRFPTLFREPGSLFLVSQTRVKDIIYAGDYKAQRMQVTQEAARQGLKQVQYPFAEALSHKNEPDKGFHGTDTLIIERSDMESAVRDQGEFLKKPWAREWFSLPGSQIITLETRGGIVTQFGEYKLSEKAS